MSDLTGTITSSADVHPPVLPEAILLTAEPGDSEWNSYTGSLADVNVWAVQDHRRKQATRIITLTPPSAREVSDAEVAAIIREHSDSLSNESDAYILEQAPVSASLVRAANTPEQQEKST